MVATDYFYKWVEVESFSNIKDSDEVQFVKKNIICRFRLSRVIVTDNGSHFISLKFKDLCGRWDIHVQYSIPRHPQGNGHTEATNKTILNTLTLNKHLKEAKGKWAEELPVVV